MQNPSEMNDLPKLHEYVPKYPAHSSLSRCSCLSCYTESIIAVENDVIIPSESPIPVRTALCEEKKDQNKVMFDNAQLLIYDVLTGSVYENKKVDIDFSGSQKDIGRMKAGIWKSKTVDMKKNEMEKKLTEKKEKNEKDEEDGDDGVIA